MADARVDLISDGELRDCFVKVVELFIQRGLVHSAEGGRALEAVKKVAPDSLWSAADNFISEWAVHWSLRQQGLL